MKVYYVHYVHHVIVTRVVHSQIPGRLKWICASYSFSLPIDACSATPTWLPSSAYIWPHALAHKKIHRSPRGDSTPPSGHAGSPTASQSDGLAPQPPPARLASAAAASPAPAARPTQRSTLKGWQTSLMGAVVHTTEAEPDKMHPSFGKAASQPTGRMRGAPAQGTGRSQRRRRW
jgi:hypothetical protein